MITINNGRISFVEKHLFDPKIELFDGIIERYKGYHVELFLHVVSDPSCRYEKGVGSTRTSKDIAELSAKERFLSLLRRREITANPKGFYANKFKKGEEFPDEIKSVSFAHCKQEEVHRHFEARNSEYGIIFYHDFLQSLGMIPVRYVNEEDEESIRCLVFNEPFALEAYGGNYDMRWEKEWRINKSLVFETQDVAFIPVPGSEYHEFINLTIHENLDYLVLPASVFTDPFQFFLIADSMEHHSWQQIRIYGDWKVDFEMFPKFTDTEKEVFLKECGLHIECLAKAEIQNVYEHRYISRFLNFASRLDDDFLRKTSFNELSLVHANAGEPYQTHRDLMMHCYTARFEIQRENIDLP
uniref:ORF356 n=1 Tax=Stutzerimonas stutzeri TaxID=316 RepID=Q8GEB6_STUST|nr:ORF356 [Stutzerimonas stutzeri]